MIDNLSPGEYTVNITRVGYRHNDVYTAYLDLGSPAGLPNTPSHLPDDVLAKLRSKCTGKPETRKFAIRANDPLMLDLPMNENDVYLITVEP